MHSAERHDAPRERSGGRFDFPNGPEIDYPIAMLHSLLRHTELRHMLDLVSPAFWQVVAPHEAWRVGRQLVGNYRTRQPFDRALADLTRDAALGLRIGSCSTPLLQVDPTQRREVGHRVLRLYFAQLLQADTAVLDLRPEHFSVHAVPGTALTLHWAPRPYYLSWPPFFIDGVRGMYRGFYEQDERLFDQALAQLNLQPAKTAFVQHFGPDQHAVRFRTAQLIESLHESFVSCRRERSKLSGAFLALGFYLVTLYQTLELLDVPLDVCGVFQQASRRPRSQEAAATARPQS